MFRKLTGVVLAVSLVGFIVGIGYLSYAQEQDNDPHTANLVLPTPEEIDLFVKTHPKIIKVLPNKIGLERVNTARHAKGLAPLSEEGVATIQGDDLISAIPGKAPKKTSAVASFAVTSLPAYVDNSQLQAFPPIRTQGSLGSCCCFSSSYYQLTHMAGLIYGWNNKNEDNTTKFSPRWAFNFTNNGTGSGGGFYDDWNILEGHGAATWAEFPYDGVDYKQWCLDPLVWEHAIHYRINTIQIITNVDTTAGLDQLKTLLNNGYVVTFPTFINSWQWTKIKDDPSTPDDNAFVGKDIAYWVNGTLGGHAMTIVGYNDTIWCDINGNRRVDAGEKGALRVANSWGTAWRESGFSWVAYDALKLVSGVSGGPSKKRGALIVGKTVYVMTLRNDYTPKLLAKFTVNHLKRNQLRMHLGTSGVGATGPSVKWYPGVFSLRGGAVAFDGSTTAINGTFVLDLTDILTPPGDTAKTYWLGILDSTAGDPARLLSFKLIDKINNVESPDALSNYLDVDNGQQQIPLDYLFTPSAPTITNNPPVATALASPMSGTAPLAVHFTGSGTDSDGTIANTVWVYGDLGNGEGSVSPVADYTYPTPGVYSAKFTVRDDDGAESSDAVLITVSAGGGARR